MNAEVGPADVAFMAEALRLAKLGRGTTWPNPMVGALVVGGGRVVGRGWHERPGRAHAEVAALGDAGDEARGSTCYVTLEPCSHHGRTPPCADALVAAGVADVVYGARDPNPQVAGRGLGLLREAGLRVRGPVLPEDCLGLNGPFVVAMEQGRAAVSIKLALTLDGMLADAGGRSAWITGGTARRRVHRLRAFHQAVMVGASTLRADDPRLTPRDHDGAGRERVIRVIVSSGRLELSGRRILEDLPEQPVWLLVPEDRMAEPAVARAAELGVLPRAVANAAPGRLDLGAALHLLADEGVIAVLCEGGAELAAGLLRARLADRLHIFRAPRLLGSGGGRPGIDDLGVRALADAVDLRRIALYLHGEDVEEVLVPPGGPWTAPD